MMMSNHKAHKELKSSPPEAAKSQIHHHVYPSSHDCWHRCCWANLPLIFPVSIKCLFRRYTGWRCVDWLLFPVLLCAVIPAVWWELCKMLSPHRRVCLPDSGFSHKLVPACRAATSEASPLSACEMPTRVRVWYWVSKCQSNLIRRWRKKKKGKERDASSLPVITGFGGGVRKLMLM